MEELSEHPLVFFNFTGLAILTSGNAYTWEVPYYVVEIISKRSVFFEKIMIGQVTSIHTMQHFFTGG